jgi:glycosyltransferase involved in cell wall biosynthesis
MITSEPVTNFGKPMLGLIFSRDRALQLDATLRSFLNHCSDPNTIQLAVLYSNTNCAFDRRYEFLARTYPDVWFVRETDFRSQVVDLVADHASVLFMVDDNIFVKEFHLADAEAELSHHSDCLGVSLRLGRNTTHCFSLNAAQRLPQFDNVPGGLLKYRWTGTDGDFGYPLEVSSSLYHSAVILPVLRQISFKNPNTFEAEFAARATTLAKKRPSLLCYATSRTFCLPLNLVQNEFANRAADDAELSPQRLGSRFDDGWRVDVVKLAGYEPPGCHHVMPLLQVRDSTLAVDVLADVEDQIAASNAKGAASWSVVIPCFNQGRFLIDCLESLACQTVFPAEVFVVNDGSTDLETLKLFENLPYYHYPFPLQVLHKQNGGLSSARNYGIDRCRSDFILPLDADDKLTPNAIEAYTVAFHRQPNVDILYPDVATFGNASSVTPGLGFNAWKLTHFNLGVCSSAIRRRVFDAGCRYDERMRKGYEDWEFWIRTCALGPFSAAPLGLPVFCYRQWGYSMLAAVDQQQVVTQIRSLHEQAGLWSDIVENRLRKEHAPSHCIFTDNPAEFESLNDLRTASRTGIAGTLAQDRTARFVWFGNFPSAWTAAMQLAVGELAARQPKAAAFAFVASETRRPYCVVFDRLWALLRPFRYSRPALQAGPVISIETSGEKQLLIQKVARKRRLGVAEHALLPQFLHTARHTDLLPRGHETDYRVSKETWLFLERQPERPRRVEPPGDERVLVIALSWLLYGGADLATLLLLEDETIRSRFDRIVLIVFEDESHPMHARFEKLADSIVHLGKLGLDDEAKLEIGLDVCRTVGATDFFINNSRHGYELIPRIRKAKLPIRISAQIHGFEFHPWRRTLTEGYPRLLASRYANLIDRVASISDNLTSRMTDELYFPRSKIRTVRLGIDQSQFNVNPRAESSADKQVAWVGRLHDGKDPLLALEVAQEYHRQHPGTRFVFVGDGPLAGTFAKRVDRARRSGMDVHWIRQTDHVETVLQASDCLFMTTRHEGIPIVIMEAFSCGLPAVMCLANTAAAELAHCGRFFEVSDRTSVQETCERLEQALAAGCMQSAPQELSRERYAQAMWNWLFEPDAAGTTSQLTSVFGVNAAA